MVLFNNKWVYWYFNVLYYIYYLILVFSLVLCVLFINFFKFLVVSNVIYILEEIKFYSSYF